ncbi:hypothetical protein Psi01_30860 [Planobispora siamensis]|uniref:Uncharacterized protein n=1 Tax=Planobispora siamensis TaxID=936338 RepID=A0A8J3SD37_9ACTN|nr:hypothetical protein Psi01_30860 [Planobispora siamensis]
MERARPPGLSPCRPPYRGLGREDCEIGPVAVHLRSEKEIDVRPEAPTATGDGGSKLHQELVDGVAAVSGGRLPHHDPAVGEFDAAIRPLCGDLRETSLQLCLSDFAGFSERSIENLCHGSIVPSPWLGATCLTRDVK